MLKDLIRERLISELTGKGTEPLQNTPVTFSMQVEKLSIHEGCTLLESLTFLVEEYELDFEQVPKLITPGLKQKLAYETGIEKLSTALPI